MQIAGESIASDIKRKHAALHRRLFIVPSDHLSEALRWTLPLTFNDRPALLMAFTLKQAYPGFQNHTILSPLGKAAYYPDTCSVPCLPVGDWTNVALAILQSQVPEDVAWQKMRHEARRHFSDFVTAGVETLSHDRGLLVIACEHGAVRSACLAALIYASALGYGFVPKEYNSLIVRCVDDMLTSHLSQPWNDNAGLLIVHGLSNLTQFIPEYFLEDQSSGAPDAFNAYLTALSIFGKRMKTFPTMLKGYMDFGDTPYYAQNAVWVINKEGDKTEIWSMSETLQAAHRATGLSLADLGITPSLKKHFGGVYATLSAAGVVLERSAYRTGSYMPLLRA